MTAIDELRRLLDESGALRWKELCAKLRKLGEQYEVLVADYRSEIVKLRQLVLALSDCRNTTCDDCVRWDYQEGECTLDGVIRELELEDK